MKKLTVLILSFILVFAFCKKNSTSDNGSQKEEISKVKVIVQDSETSDPLAAYDVEIEARVKHYISWSGEGMPDADRYSITTETNSGITNQYGYIIFVYEDKMIPDEKRIVVTKITVRNRQMDKVYEEEMEVGVPNGTTKEFIIEVET